MIWYIIYELVFSFCFYLLSLTISVEKDNVVITGSLTKILKELGNVRLQLEALIGSLSSKQKMIKSSYMHEKMRSNSGNYILNHIHKDVYGKFSMAHNMGNILIIFKLNFNSGKNFMRTFVFSKNLF